MCVFQCHPAAKGCAAFPYYRIVEFVKPLLDSVPSWETAAFEINLFMRLRRWRFDDETCRLEPLPNPFGPKVLPMSQE